MFGNQALIGAVGNFNNGFETGAAYIFKLQNGNWLESMKLVPSDGASRMLFGSSVSLANNRALIGAHLDNEGGIYAGAAYVYESPNGAVWNETAKLTSLNPSETDQLGVSVSLSGNRALLGAYTNESGTASGSAYVFENDGNQWQQTAHIVPDGLNEMDFFGQSVSLAGNRALIGAQHDQDNGFNSGAAFYYELSNTTGVWDEKQKLGASNGSSEDFFGRSVSLLGNRALVGTPRRNAIGLAYVYSIAPLGTQSVPVNQEIWLIILMFLMLLVVRKNAR